MLCTSSPSINWMQDIDLQTQCHHILSHGVNVYTSTQSEPSLEWVVGYKYKTKRQQIGQNTMSNRSTTFRGSKTPRNSWTRNYDTNKQEKEGNTDTERDQHRVWAVSPREWIMGWHCLQNKGCRTTDSMLDCKRDIFISKRQIIWWILGDHRYFVNFVRKCRVERPSHSLHCVRTFAMTPVIWSGQYLSGNGIADDVSNLHAQLIFDRSAIRSANAYSNFWLLDKFTA